MQLPHFTWSDVWLYLHRGPWALSTWRTQQGYRPRTAAPSFSPEPLLSSSGTSWRLQPMPQGERGRSSPAKVTSPLVPLCSQTPALLWELAWGCIFMSQTQSIALQLGGDWPLRGAAACETSLAPSEVSALSICVCCQTTRLGSGF